MIINHNLSALNTYNKLTSANNANGKSMEKLSSGLRINRAGDDAAGLAISEKMRGQIRGLDQGSRNAQDGISMIQTAEGALSETHSILQRMRELATQSANDTNVATDRSEIQKEVNALTSEINRIANTTEFNTQKLLNGGTGTSGTTIGSGFTADFQIGANNGQSMSIEIKAMDAKSLGLAISGAEAGTNIAHAVGSSVGSGGLAIATSGISGASYTDTSQVTNGTNNSGIYAAINVSASSGALGLTTESTHQTASAAIKAIDLAIETVSAQRSNLGAFQNRLEHTINNLTTSSENLTAAESRVRDVDMAKEIMQQVKNAALGDSSQAMLLKTNQSAQKITQLVAQS